MRHRSVRSVFLLGALLLVAPAAQAVPLDRVVAVVDDTPIFLSDLRARARPHLLQIEASKPPDATKRAAMESQLYRDLLQRLIDEALVARAASAAHLSVDRSEVDRAIEAVAQRAQLTRERLLEEAKKQGFEPDDYRAEVSRQILEGKWLHMKSTKPPAGVDDATAAKHYETERKRLLEELRTKTFVDVRL
jgi:peptidyl-prolyl cis-trans isomerase SurA